jgi:three-Cys-motif partner protein
VSDSDESKWIYPPHTKAKHDMLSRYLDGWYPILSSGNQRVVFLDGFAGRGRYINGAEGSPLIALRRLIEHDSFPRMSEREFVFIFVEANEDNARSLAGEVDRFKADNAPWPANVTTEVRNSRFDDTATDIIEYLRTQKANLAPTFAFVDPFGYSGLPMELLADLLAYPKTEVFVNFMVNHVNRFITRDGQESAMRSLFGIEVQQILADYTGRDRTEYLRDVYGAQLRERAGFNYVQSFAMKNNTGNVGYYLFHGTRHLKGVKLMKDAMWKIDPGGGNVFSDKLAGLDVLFVPDPDLEPLRRVIEGRFGRARRVSIEDLETFVLTETPYRETHVRPVLRPLEKAGAISVERPGRHGFPAGTLINFG